MTKRHSGPARRPAMRLAHLRKKLRKGKAAAAALRRARSRKKRKR